MADRRTYASRHGRELWAAAGVHVFTASGIVCALLATRCLIEHTYAQMFAWLGLALVIDGIDGTFARMFNVKQRLPRFSGERLDLVVDYVTYVFVPALALLHSGILSGTVGLGLAALILMSALFHFSDEASKTADHCFVGFPAIWNIVAFYLFAFPLGALGAGLIVIVCVMLTFIPMRWLHPMRVERYMVVNIVASALWLIAAAATLWTGFPAPFWAAVVLAGVGVYTLVLTLFWPWADTRGDRREERQ